MTPVRRTEYEQLSRDEAARVDAACDRFEKSWKEIAADAEAPDIGPYCADNQEPARTVLAWELMALDRIYRERRGETPEPDAYRGLCAEYDQQLSPHELTSPRSQENRHVHTRIGPNLPGLQITQVLGSGGMGIVYKAWQAALDRYVAVKMLRSASLVDREQRERFEQEARAVARLQHPNMVQVYAIGETQADDGTDHVPYFVLEYVSGGSLADFLKGTPQPPRAAAQLVETLARAICHVHDQGIIHRDLKPANVLLQAHGALSVGLDSPKITDFGLAKLAAGSDLTRTGDTLGTPSYMAPEQIDGNSLAIGAATDVYGLGAILYETLTGRPPFQGETPLTTVLQVQRDDAVSPRRLQPTVPRNVETICMKCLQKDPRARYANAQGLADDLRRFLDGRPIAARPVGAPEMLVRWCRRNPRVAGLLVLVAVLVFVVLVGAPLAAFHLHNARAQALLEKWDAYREAAAARRSSQQSGQRFLSLTHLAEAARTHPSLQLRNEAIACLTLADLYPIRRWEGNPQADATVAFDREFRRYAFVDTEGGIRLRHVADDQEICRLFIAGAAASLGVRFSSDGRYLAAIHHDHQGGAWRIWDLLRQQTVQTLPIGKILYLPFEFRPDGDGWAVAQPDRSIGVYEDGSSQPVKVLAPVRGLDHVSFRPRHRQLAVSSSSEGTVEVREVDTDNVVASLPHPAGVRALAWSQDGQVLATACDDLRVYVWKVNEGRRIAVLDGHRETVIFLGFVPGGDLLVSGSWDGSTRLWNIRTNRYLVRAQGIALGFSPDGSRLAFRDGQQVGVWHLSEERHCRTIPHRAVGQGTDKVDYRGKGVDFSPDGRMLASGGDGVQLWSLEPLLELAHLPAGPTDTVRFHPDRNTLFTFGPNGLHRWTLQSDIPGTSVSIGAPRLVSPRRTLWPGFHDFGFDRAGRTLVAAGDAQKWQVLVLPLDSLDEPVMLHALPYVASVALSPDGRWVATGAYRYNGVKVLDAKTGALVKHLPTGENQNNGATVTFSPDGRWLVTGAPRGYRFWEVGTWEPRREVKRERSIEPGLGLMAFSPDGEVLAITSSTQSVRLVSTSTGAELATLTAPDPQPITCLCFSPDGERLAVATMGDVFQLWDLRRLREQLAAMNLDWEQPPFPPRNADESSSTPLQVRVLPGDLPAPPP